MKFKLIESSQLYKGIFWIKDVDNPTTDLFFQIPSDVYGNTDEEGLTAKSGLTHNHEKVWKSLNIKLTDGKAFNYYPRGRVEISNCKANIYLNPILCTDRIKELLIKEFNLTSHNGIKKISFKADGSDHYKCYLDE